MAALSEAKIAIVRTLVEAAPDKVVGSLRQALSQTSDDSALGGVRRLVESEASDRLLRNLILQPVAPLCVGGADPAALTFPPRALPLIWRGLREIRNAQIEWACAATEDATPEEKIIHAYDELAAAAAAELRSREFEPFRLAAEICDQARPGGAEQLAQCLDLAAVVRSAVHRMPEWFNHPGGESSAAARLAYKDAVAISDDAGPRFFLMIAAQMAQPWMVLRAISAVMERPKENYLAASELGVFAERVLDDVDHSLRRVGGLDPDAGAEAGQEAAALVELAVNKILEIETCIELQRDQGWGQRISGQRGALATVVESRLRDAEKATINALPMQPSHNHRVRRAIPYLEAPPIAKLVGRATTLLTFSNQLQTTANYGGFSSARAKMVEKVGEHLDQYVDEVIDLLRTGDAPDAEIATAYLDVAADFSRLIRGEKARDLVRRRTHAALHPETSLQA